MLKDDKDRMGYANGGYDLHEDFIDSNDKFAKRMAEMYTADVKNTKDRDKAVEGYIRDKVKVAKTLGLDKFNKEYYEKEISKARREIDEENNPLLGTRQIKADGGPLVGDQKKLDVDGDGTIDSSDLKKLREQKQEGGLLEDDREQFFLGGLKEKLRGMKKYDVDSSNVGGIFQILEMLKENRQNYEEGGSIDDQMMMVMTPSMESEMEPDGEMEDNYTRFIMEEALTEEEEDMLMSKLEQDEELAMIFDKVIDVAQEFAGAGPVEGPGSGVSDSIPARLSDGEFVFTAKAVEEIGADNLMAMMKDAEAKADERQPLQEGGTPELREETRPIETPKMVEQTIRVERGPQTEQVGVSGSLLDSREEDEEYTNPLERPPIHGAYTR